MPTAQILTITYRGSTDPEKNDIRNWNQVSKYENSKNISKKGKSGNGGSW